MFTYQDLLDLDFSLDCAIYENEEFVKELWDVWNSKKNEYTLNRIAELKAENKRLQNLKNKIKNEL